MGDIAKNVGEFTHGGFWILEWGILNVHRNILFDFSKLVTSHRRMERIQKYYRHIIDGHQKPSKASEKPIEVEDVPVDEPKVRTNF